MSCIAISSLSHTQEKNSRPHINKSPQRRTEGDKRTEKQIEREESRRENKSKNQSSGTLTQQTFFFFTMSGKSAQRMLANRRAREDELYSAEIKLREDQNLSALG